MATKDFKFHLQFVPTHSAYGAPFFTLTETSDMSEHGWVRISTHVLTVELPDEKTLLQPQLAALEKLKQDTRAKFAMAIKEIDDRINSLLAIENSVAG